MTGDDVERTNGIVKNNVPHTYGLMIRIEQGIEKKEKSFAVHFRLPYRIQVFASECLRIFIEINIHIVAHNQCRILLLSIYSF